MDKINIGLVGEGSYVKSVEHVGDGLCHGREDISFPGNSTLEILLASTALYNVEVCGDVEVLETEGGLERSRQIFARWSAQAQSQGTGGATIAISDPRYPTRALFINLSLGKRGHTHYLHGRNFDSGDVGDASQIFPLYIYGGKDRPHPNTHLGVAPLPHKGYHERLVIRYIRALQMEGVKL